MIFVTLGTQDKSFIRLLRELDEMIKDGTIRDKVVVQCGATVFESPRMKIFPYANMKKFNKYVRQCDLLIAHGGVGSILGAISVDSNKKVLAVARLEKYDEHESDHQVQIINEFDKRGYIIGCLDAADLRKAYARVADFKPIPYKSNNEHFCSVVKELIEK